MTDTDTDFHHGPLSIVTTADEYNRSRYYVCDELTGDWLGEPFDTYEAAAAEITRLHSIPETGLRADR